MWLQWPAFVAPLGEVWITLNCKVGRIIPPMSPSPPPPFAAKRKTYRNKSYYRRQARPRAEREGEISVSKSVITETASYDIETTVDSFAESEQHNDSVTAEMANTKIITQFDDESQELQEEAVDDVVSENTLVKSNSIEEQLEALIHKSQKNREDWERMKEYENNG